MIKMRLCQHLIQPHFLFSHLHNINKITIFALRRCMKSCTTQNLRKDHGRSRI
nr:MAG TPA: Histidine kinase [Caudoviricetes sp.]